MSTTNARLVRLVNRIALLIGLLAALGIIGLIAGVAILVQQRNRTVILPSTTGPYAVGRAEYDWIDASRPEIFSSQPGASRELLVWIWYPAEPAPGASLAPYLPEAWANARDRDLSIGQLLFQRPGAIRTHTISGAPVSNVQPPYPVLIFSTGFGRLPADYTVLAEDLASHGYIVAGIANPYSAPVVVFPDGRIIYRVRAAAFPETSAEADRQAGDRLVKVWAADILSTMDQLDKLNRAPGPFSGRLDLGLIGVLGHSFGGAASAEACRLDSRCKAGIDLDGTLFGDVVAQGVPQPFLFVSSQATPGAHERDKQTFQSSLNRGATWITIEGTGHFSFADMAVTFAPIARWTGSLGSIQGRRGLEITSAYVRAFFDQSLNRVDSPLLRAPSPRYPEVHFESP